MPLRDDITGLFTNHSVGFTHCAHFHALEAGHASPQAYVGFLEQVIRTHLTSPPLLAFLFAVAPPQARDNLQRNLLEELGVDPDSPVAHPVLLKQLAVAAGLAHRLPFLEAQAEADLRQLITTPLLYGTLKEVGLAALYEVTAFEFLLAHVAQRIATALTTHCGLNADALQWFTHHAVVDHRHAAQGIDNLLAYIDSYDFSDGDARTMLTLTFRENVFIKRYFGSAQRNPSETQEVI